MLGRGGGEVVSVLTLYSNDLSLNQFFNINFMFEKNKNKQKEARVGPLKKRNTSVNRTNVIHRKVLRPF